jgi:alpha-ketoglutarate-dependent taurine dioxygenase
MNNSDTAASAAMKQAWIEKRRTLKPKALSLSRSDLVKIEHLPETPHLPVVVRPNYPDLELAGWLAENLDWVNGQLHATGGVLFRGFGVDNAEALSRAVEGIGLKRMPYMEGATPRTELGSGVYTSTEYPPDEYIALHNELNYVVTWPMRILFCCQTAPTERGETPIADVRRVWARLPEEIREEFRRRGWMLVRNFGDGMSLDWRRSFRVGTEKELEEYCRGARVEWEWKEGGRLRTRQVRPAVRRHPVTGEEVWFNHVAFWHVSSLRDEVRELFAEEFGDGGWPYNTYYGDGGEIPDEAVAEVRRAYDEETVAFRWERGDLIVLDNMLVAHGRRPYAGERRVLVSMGDPYSDFV